jgi:hypothetical protein
MGNASDKRPLHSSSFQPPSVGLVEGLSMVGLLEEFQVTAE